MNAPITGAQQRLLAALRSHITNHGDMPSAQQLANAAGMKSPAAVRNQLGHLLLCGYIRNDPSQPCGLSISDPENYHAEDQS